MSSYSLDILTPEDAQYVPFAKSLLDRAKAYMRANNHGEFFTKWYAFEDVTILIRIWPEGEYIQVRAGKPGDFLVLPVVRRISTDTTTTGGWAFLNSKLTKATSYPAGDSAGANFVPSLFQHREATVKKKRYLGFATNTPALKSTYFIGQTHADSNLSKQNEYAGVFKHKYTDSVTSLPAFEFLHARAAVTPTSGPISTTQGLYKQSDGSLFIDFSLYTFVWRPALNLSMFANETGTKIVAEERFGGAGLRAVPSPYNATYSTWVLRSFIDIDMGNVGTPAIFSDTGNPGAYSADDVNANGTGSKITRTIGNDAPSLLSPPMVRGSYNQTVSGQQVYPISTALSSSDALIHNNWVADLDTQSAFSNLQDLSHSDYSASPPASPSEFRIETESRNYSKNDRFTIKFRDGAIVASELSTSEYSRGAYTANIFRNYTPAITSTITVTTPYQAGKITKGVTLHYSDAYLRALIFTETTNDTSYVFNAPTVGSDDDFGLGVANVSVNSASLIVSQRLVAQVGLVQRVLYDETADPVAGSVVLPGETHPYTDTNTDVTTTLPSGLAVNSVAIPNRNVSTFVQFAAQTEKAYIGSVRAFTLASPGTRIPFTFSHADAALKKTIVNYVLEPVDPIEGAALDDYEIWFTAIRAI